MGGRVIAASCFTITSIIRFISKFLWWFSCWEYGIILDLRLYCLATMRWKFSRWRGLRGLNHFFCRLWRFPRIFSIFCLFHWNLWNYSFHRWVRVIRCRRRLYRGRHPISINLGNRVCRRGSRGSQYHPSSRRPSLPHNRHHWDIWKLLCHVFCRWLIDPNTCILPAQWHEIPFQIWSAI